MVSDEDRGTNTVSTAPHDSLDGTDLRHDSRTPGKLSNGFGGCSAQMSMPPRKRLCQRKIKLKHFNMPVADEVQTRFRNSKELFEKLLYDYLSQDGQRLTPIAIALQCLGEDQADAKPWIVVLCDKSLSEKVRQWFRTPYVKSLCQSQDADLDADAEFPIFRVLVHEQPPQLLSGDVYSIGMLGPDANHFTMCGRLLRTKDPKHGRLATFGGLLKLAWETRFAIYGITVQHVFEDNLCFETEMPQESRSEMTFENANKSHEENYEVFELEIPTNNDVTKGQSDTLVSTKDPSEPASVTRIGIQCPGKSDISNIKSRAGVKFCECVASGQNHLLDWALFDIEDSSKLWPNLRCGSVEAHDLNMQESMRFEEGLGQNVYVMSGMTGCIRGRISKVSSFIALPKTHRLIETYCLSLDDGSELQPGDSGSWVVDANTHTVYGQVVASDVFKNVYVVPFGSIVQEIKDTYGAKTITFPTHDELDFCAFARPHNAQKDRDQQYDSIEDSCGQFELAGLDSYLSGNMEISGVIRNTSDGSFVPTADAREATRSPSAESKRLNDARYASKWELQAAGQQ